MNNLLKDANKIKKYYNHIDFLYRLHCDNPMFLYANDKFLSTNHRDCIHSGLIAYIKTMYMTCNTDLIGKYRTMIGDTYGTSGYIKRIIEKYKDQWTN